MWRLEDCPYKIITLCFTAESVLDFCNANAKVSSVFYSALPKSSSNATTESMYVSVQSCCKKKRKKMASLVCLLANMSNVSASSRRRSCSETHRARRVRHERITSRFCNGYTLIVIFLGVCNFIFLYRLSLPPVTVSRFSSHSRALRRQLLRENVKLWIELNCSSRTRRSCAMWLSFRIASLAHSPSVLNGPGASAALVLCPRPVVLILYWYLNCCVLPLCSCSVSLPYFCCCLWFSVSLAVLLFCCL